MSNTNGSSSSGLASGWTAGHSFQGAFAGAAAGAVVNVALYFLAGALGVALTAHFAGPAAPASALPVAPVLISSMVPAIPAALVALVVGRLSKSPGRIYAVLAAAFGLLSLAGPARLGAASLGLVVLLSAMHVVSGAGITLGILRANRQ